MNNQVTPVSTQYAYPLEVSRGNIPGAEPFGSYGKRTATGAVTEQMLWPNGAFLLPPAAGLEMTAVSTSTADSSAGTGIRTIQIHYLDPLLGVASVSVALNGQTNQCIHATSWGSGKKAAGTISIFNGSQTYGLIAVGGMPYTQSSTATVSGGWFGWVENA